MIAVLAAGMGLLGGYVLFGRASLVADVIATASASEPSVTRTDAPLPQEPAAQLAALAQVVAARNPDTPTGSSAELPAVPVTAEAEAEPVEAEQALPGTPAPAPQPASAATACSASVETRPAGARVKLDGRDVGDSPLASLEVPCAQEVSVTIEHPRYRKVERRLTVNPGEPGRVEARLVRPAAHVKLVSTPPGAIITVDGKVIGRSPADTESSAFGTVFVTATLNGYKVWARHVRVKGTDVTIQARLDAVPGAR